VASNARELLSVKSRLKSRSPGLPRPAVPKPSRKGIPETLSYPEWHVQAALGPGDAIRRAAASGGRWTLEAAKAAGVGSRWQGVLGGSAGLRSREK